MHTLCSRVVNETINFLKLPKYVSHKTPVKFATKHVKRESCVGNTYTYISFSSHLKSWFL